MTQPGELNRRLVLEEPVETDDGAGGVTVTYQTAATVWAQVEPASARGNIAADSLGAAAGYRITLRERAGITARHRFRDGARIFRIVALRDSGDRRFLIIDAEERKD